MIDNLTPFVDLMNEANEMQRFAETSAGDNAWEICERIVNCSVYVARTGKMLADAKYYLNAKKKDETVDLITRLITKDKLSAKVQNALMDSICRDEQHLVDSIERLNRALTHQMEALRSLLSYEKENLRISKNGY